jgi:hypothetical protein
MMSRTSAKGNIASCNCVHLWRCQEPQGARYLNSAMYLLPQWSAFVTFLRPQAQTIQISFCGVAAGLVQAGAEAWQSELTDYSGPAGDVSGLAPGTSLRPCRKALGKSSRSWP